MQQGLRPVDHQHETLSSEVARRLLDYLLSGAVKPGERIPSERKLSEALGVGRSVIREALKSVTVLGLLEVRQGDGTYLKRTDSELLPQTIEWGLMLGAKRITDLLETRRYLEVVVVGLAAERRDEANLERLRQHAASMRQAETPADFVAADIAFHLEIATAAGNESLLQIMRSIRSLLQVWITRVMESSGANKPTWAEHAAVLRAIERGDPAAARKAMEAHMVGATKRLNRALAQDPDAIATPPIAVPAP